MVHPKEKAEARKRLFATRFKTEMCRTYEIQGSCPYTHKCMFAHGPADLRTEVMNERDGLTSALAVRRWMLGLIYSNHRQGHRGNHSHHHDSDHTTSDDEPLHQHQQHQNHPMPRIAHSSKPSTPKMVSGAHFVEFDECVKPRTGTWRHEPYSWIVPFVTCCSHDHHHHTDSD